MKEKVKTLYDSRNKKTKDCEFKIGLFDKMAINSFEVNSINFNTQTADAIITFPIISDQLHYFKHFFNRAIGSRYLDASFAVFDENYKNMKINYLNFSAKSNTSGPQVLECKAGVTCFYEWNISRHSSDLPESSSRIKTILTSSNLLVEFKNKDNEMIFSDNITSFNFFIQNSEAVKEQVVYNYKKDVETYDILKGSINVFKTDKEQDFKDCSLRLLIQGGGLKTTPIMSIDNIDITYLGADIHDQTGLISKYNWKYNKKYFDDIQIAD
jgi:hypothetical protein